MGIQTKNHMNHMIISIDEVKNIQRGFLKKKILKRVGLEGLSLNTIQAIYNKPTANLVWMYSN